MWCNVPWFELDLINFIDFNKTSLQFYVAVVHCALFGITDTSLDRFSKLTYSKKIGGKYVFLIYSRKKFNKDCSTKNKTKINLFFFERETELTWNQEKLMDYIINE